MSDHDTISRLKAQDHTAWEETVATHYKSLVLFCGRFVNDESDAYGIAHDTYMKAKKRIHSFNSEKYSSFRPWLWQIAKNEAIDFLTSHKKDAERTHTPVPSKSATTEFYLKIADLRPGPQTNAHMNGIYKALYDALDKIDPIFREIIMLRYVDHLSRREIAEYLEIPENTAKSRLRVALQKLRVLIPDI